MEVSNANISVWTVPLMKCYDSNRETRQEVSDLRGDNMRRKVKLGKKIEPDLLKKQDEVS